MLFTVKAQGESVSSFRTGENASGFLFLSARAAVFALLGLFTGLCAYCIFHRVTYPFEIEWLEGELICHSIQLLKGNSLYAPPTTEFISELYPPFYYVVSAVFFKLAGSFNFLIPRLLSVLC